MVHSNGFSYAYEPNLEECRTSPLMPAFSDCRVKIPKCRYADPTHFGHGYFCKHPNHAEFQKNAGQVLPEYMEKSGPK